MYMVDVVIVQCHSIYVIMCHYVSLCVDTRYKALLTLGSMANLVRDADPLLSADIVQLLLWSLQHCDGDNGEHTEDNGGVWSLPPPSAALRRVLVDSIGNTRDNASLVLLHQHIREWSKSSVGDAHTAIRALRHHHDEQVSYTVLLLAMLGGKILLSVNHYFLPL